MPVHEVWVLVQVSVQRLAMVLFAAVAAGLVIVSGLCLVGYWEWPGVMIAWQGELLPAAGMWLTLTATVLAIAICFFLPSNRRVLRLEAEHRNFHMGVDDVTRAYVAAHAADRAGLFHSGEAFEAMKERLEHMRDHPDLSNLEPEILELAAQMSFASRQLATRYADDKVARARAFLEERQYELDRFNERVEHAKAISLEFKTWINRLELEEHVATAQMERLLDELERILPELNATGSLPGGDEPTNNVTRMPKRTE